ncbi:baeRF2 domain-containing protein [Microbacterium album]|uniref:Peptide chain release factor 1 n=1 Tax=Microbacterium album TaxID=2053191 RepID=A0A917ML62_9MICO|nr:Vms1/Ankzf1 family peptidyl-tRNA hydrolase [Microbacterium album]GGH40617.1 hypothetical protein GCM10010921_12690 [Microbacterium album]
MADGDLSTLLAQPGPWTSVYTDGRGGRPQSEEDALRRSVLDRLHAAGAPEADVRAVADALEEGQRLPSPSLRCLLVRDGRVVLDEPFTGRRLGPEVVDHGAVPRILPVLRHRAAAIPYLVVETGREGALLRLQTAHRAGATHAEEVEGRTDSLNKVQAGGWSHRRYQAHSEDIWEQNQSEVAEAVDRIVREQHPRFVVLAGDVRARQLLHERIAPAGRDLVVEVESHTKAEGSDDTALHEAIAAAVDARLEAELSDIRDRAAANEGAAGAYGMTPVLEALQQARVDTLLLDERLLSADETLEALDAPPWAGTGDGDALGATPLGRVPVAEALARAAVLSGARVLVLDEVLADDEARPAGPAAAPVALLRWADER